ncbi:MAG: flagellar biosynthesis protein FlhA [Sandaracinaceae bacterium]
MHRRVSEVALAALVVSVVGMMIVPLPAWLLDVLIASNLCFSVLLLVTAVFARDGTRLGAFPTLLLVSTLYRLGLNVSSTRLILADADAGDVIAAFGTFVVQGDYVVGAVVFLILTVIQWVVIARGAERVAEVGARFTLDAMPGKQLAIDADLRAGLLDAEQAGERRRALERESQFYGAMDGAMKFVKGDAMAALLIIAINLVGGLAVGIFGRDMEAEEALRLFGRLTIGDGLVSQMPALVISTAAGLVVTRVASEREGGTLGADVAAQIFGDWRALGMAGGFSLVLAVIPGLPWAPFLVLAALLLGGAFLLRRAKPRAPLTLRDPGAPRSGPLELRVGAALAARLENDDTFRGALTGAQDRLYARLGLRLPVVEPVVAALDGDAYTIHLAGSRVDKGHCPAGHHFVVGAAEDLSSAHPSVQLEDDGGWIEGEGEAEGAVLARRLESAVMRHPGRLLGLQETSREVDRLAKEAPALVRAVVPGRATMAQLATLLRGLVEEGVSVRALREVLEALSQDPLPASDGARLATVRERLAGPISDTWSGPDGVLRAYAVDPMIEDALRDARTQNGQVAVEPGLARDVVSSVRRVFDPAEESTAPRVLLTQPDVRAALRSVLAAELPDVPILSYREIDPQMPIERLGMVSP